MGAGRESVGRTILVIEEQPYLWAALQRCVARATAYVRSVSPDELPAVWRGCSPWPWMIVAATSAASPELADLIGPRPIGVHWLGEPPADIGRRAVAHPDWMALAGELERLNDLVSEGLRGVRLMRNRGLRTPDDRVVLDVAELEGLMGAREGLLLPADGVGEQTLSALHRGIEAHGLPLRLEQDGDLVRLA